jgi:hypothetical protein
METIATLFALSLPTVAGAASALCLAAPKRVLDVLFWSGVGGLFGWAALGAIRIIQFSLGLPSGRSSLTIVYLALLTLSLTFLFMRNTFSRGGRPKLSRPLDPIEWFLVACICAVPALASINAALVPTLAWDVWGFWGILTKHWNHTSDYGFRLSAGYPPTVPMMQLWILEWQSEFDETKHNLFLIPMLLCFFAVFYSELRARGLPRTTVLVAILTLLSTPLFSVHLALVGYADLPQAFFVFLSIVFGVRILTESEEKTRSKTVTWIAYAISLICVAGMKKPGVFWALLSMLPVVVFVMQRATTFSRIAFASVLTPIFFIGVAWFDARYGYDLFALPDSRPETTDSQIFLVGTLFANSELFILAPLLLFSCVVLQRFRVRLGTVALVPLTLVCIAWALVVLGVMFVQSELFWSTVFSRALLHHLPTAIFFAACLATEARK